MIRRLLPLVAVTFLVACGGGADPSSVASQDVAVSEPAAAATTVPPAESTAPPSADASTDVPAALQFSAPLVGGGEIELDAYAGRPVLLWFWAPW